MAEWNWIDTLTRQFELCEATNGRDVVVVGTTRTPPELVDTALIALQRTGAQGSLLVLGSATTTDARSLSGSVQAALRTAELVIDCTPDGLVALPDTDMLVLGSRSPEGLEQHVPHPGLRERVRNAEKLLRARSRFLITSAGGTKLTINVSDQATILGNWGSPRPERRRAHWPGGQVSAALPSDHDTTGTVVLMPGDLNVTLGEVIHSPVSLEVEQGRICEIVGESGDADLLRAYLESFADPDAYRLVQCTLGLNHAVAAPTLFTALSADADHHSVLAAGQLSLGFGPLGHSARTDTEPMLTLGLRSATLDLGTVTPLRDGELVGEIAPDVYETAANLRSQLN